MTKEEFIEKYGVVAYGFVGQEEFTVATGNGMFRFIDMGYIDQILYDELKDEHAFLGVFSPKVISEATGWPQELIEICQEAEKFEELGRIMTRTNIMDLADIYYRKYEDYFGSYDGTKDEVLIGNIWYYVFRIN